MRNEGPQRCSVCGGQGHRYRGDRWLCVVHHRFDTMRNTARLKGKRVPSASELTLLAAATVKAGMKCPTCQVGMVWAGAVRGQPNVVSLQHDRDGTLRFICVLCNNRHKAFPGDTFYAAPPGHAFCPGRQLVLPSTAFYCRRHNGKRISRCRGCWKIIAKKAWADKNMVRS